MWLLGLHSGKLTPAVVKSDMNVLVQEVRKGQGEKIDGLGYCSYVDVKGC